MPLTRHSEDDPQQERFYDARRFLWLDELRQDVRYATRALRRSPGFTAIAVLTLALGIGANTAIFSVVNAALLRPLPYRDPGSLVLIEPGDVGLTPNWMVPAWRERARSLAGLAGFNGPRPLTLIHRDRPEVVQATDITWDFLSFLGVTPALGRDFVEGDAAPGAAGAAILSHDLWQRHFGGDPAVIGRTVSMARTPLTIVGVLPQSFRFPTAGALPAFGLPTDLQPDVLRTWNGRNSVNVIGRLRPGVTAGAATQDLLAVYREASAHEFSAEFLERAQMSVVPLQNRLVGDLSRRLWLVMGAVACVLLVGCVNVANLLLARASTREREIAVRAALGARKGRLARLLLTESLLLALLGSAGGLAFAHLTRGVARTLLSDRIPHVGAIPLDWAVMGFTVAVAVAIGVACGLVALPGASRVNLASVFTTGGSASVTGRSLTRRLLLSVETAVTFVLVVCAALLAQTLWNLRTQDNGFDTDRLLTVRVTPGTPPTNRIDPAPQPGVRPLSQYWATFFTDLRDRLQALPGVTTVGAISLAPLEGVTTGLRGLLVNGRKIADSGDRMTTYVGFVTPGYIATMRIPLLAGRDFTEADRLGAPLVAVVNEAFQRRFAPDGSILGARISSGSGSEEFTVVGITRDVPDSSLRTQPEPQLMAPLAQMPGTHIGWGSLTFALRTDRRDPRQIAPDVRRAIWSIDPNIVINSLVPMTERLAVGMRAERDSALLFGLFALAALLMAAIGVYGVAAYAIAQRTKEIGIRVALGAARAEVQRLVIRQTLVPTLAGIAIGIGAAVGLTQLVASMVYGVTPLDPLTFAAAVIVLVAVALMATWAPARRATRIDPLTALRCD